MREELERFRNDLRALTIPYDPAREEQFLTYTRLLVQWNDSMNLTAITDFDEILKKHFIDSLSYSAIYPELKVRKLSLIDVGSGAGFPGLPLKIAFPGLTVTLLDSLKKRIRFLNEVIISLHLEEICALHGRAEELARTDQLREQFSVCVSRAVAHLSVLSELCLPFLKPGGVLIISKTEQAAEELRAAEPAIHLLGGETEKTLSITLPDSDIKRTLILIRKISPTPEKYPRRPGIPARKPIE